METIRSGWQREISSHGERHWRVEGGLTYSVTVEGTPRCTSWSVVDAESNKEIFAGMVTPGELPSFGFWMLRKMMSPEYVSGWRRSLNRLDLPAAPPTDWRIADQQQEGMICYEMQQDDVRLTLQRSKELGSSWEWNVYPNSGADRIGFGMIGPGDFRNIAVYMAESWRSPERIESVFCP